jgi:tetratricopeptide (TPR) repeat protein
LVELGRIRCRLGAPDSATEAHLRALTLFRQVGDARGEAAALNGYGAALAASGDLDRARAAREEALKIARAVTSPLDEAEAEEGLAASSPPGSAAERAHAQRARRIRVRFGLIDS